MKATTSDTKNSLGDSCADLSAPSKHSSVGFQATVKD